MSPEGIPDFQRAQVSSVPAWLSLFIRGKKFHLPLLTFRQKKGPGEADVGASPARSACEVSEAPSGANEGEG